MNKTALKNFAIAARLELLQRVMNRSNLYGVNEETCKEGSIAPSSGFQKLGGELLTREEENQRDALIRRVNQQGYRQTMEEAAYTWFNRFIALRYMQEHQLLPVSQRVLPEMPGQMPEIIREAHQLSLDGMDAALVLDLLDRNETTALYRYLLISLCNALHEPLPGMFEKISDYTELLFPDGLLKDDSVLAALSKIPAEDFQDIQVIGWLYQYYNTDLKNETFELLKKNVKITKERIGAATQLFTPEWIVRYMVQNSLGRLWLEGHPEENLRMKWRYYMDEAQQEPEVAAKLTEIRQGYAAMQLEDIKLLDPCMGSGHILVYAFDMLMEIYRTMGYTDRDAVRSIVENNLYGLDIDDRAAQLAYFAVMMKACEYDRRFLRRGIQPHVYAMQESNGMPEDAWGYFSGCEKIVRVLYRAFEHAKDFGSLIAPDVTLVDLTLLESQMEEMTRHAEYADLATQALIATALAAMQPLMEQARILVNKYDVVVTNPPYAGKKGLNGLLSNYLETFYPTAKGDLFATFIFRVKKYLVEHGYASMITPTAWMYNPSYADFRKDCLQELTVNNLVEVGSDAFEVGFGTAMFTFMRKISERYLGLFSDIKLNITTGIIPDNMADVKCYSASMGYFREYEGYKFSYKLSPAHRQVVLQSPTMSVFGKARAGLQTDDNARFIREWFEVCCTDIEFSHKPKSKFEAHKWFPHIKGGTYRKWYGNLSSVVDWQDNGKRIKDNASAKYGSYSKRVQSEEYYFHEGIAWTHTTYSQPFSCRFLPEGIISNVEGPAIFDTGDKQHYIIGLLNTKVMDDIFSRMSDSIHYLAGELSKFPVVYSDKKQIVPLVKECIKNAQDDWDAFETSWDFKKHPLV